VLALVRSDVCNGNVRPYSASALLMGTARQYYVAVRCTKLLRDGTCASVNVQRNAEAFRRGSPHGADVGTSGAAERIWVDTSIGGLL
jgi:hypothetical protein